MAIWHARSRRMAATQAAINDRTGRVAGAAPAAPVAGAAAPVATTNQWFSTRVANIALIIAAVVISVWGLYFPAEWSDPSPAKMGTWGRGHWFSLLLLWGIGAALIWLNASERATKTLQMVLAGTVAAMLIIFPLFGWMASQSASAPAPARTAAAQPEAQTLVVPANSDSVRIHTKPGYRIDYAGNGFSVHCAYRDGSEGIVGDKENPCKDGPMQYQYVRDMSGKANSVTYEFVRP